MEERVQYVFPNTSLLDVAKELREVVTESSETELISKVDGVSRWTQHGLFDELMVSYLRFIDTDEILRIEAIENPKDVVLRIGPCWTLNKNNSVRRSDDSYLSNTCFTISDISFLGYSLHLQNYFEEHVLKRMVKHHKDWNFFYRSVIVHFFNHHFLALLIGYLFSVFLLCWSLKKMQKRWKIITLLPLIVVPLMVLLVSVFFQLMDNQLSNKNKVVPDVLSRDNYSGGTDIYKLTFLIVRDNPVADFIDEHPGIDIDCSDNVYDNSLLMFSIIHNSYTSTKELLECHVNPNYISSYNGGTPLLKTLQILDDSGNPDTLFLALVLSFGADANRVTYDKRHEKKRVPLLEVRSLEQARLLVEQGGSQVTKDIIDDMEQEGLLYPFVNDSTYNRIIKYYESLLVQQRR